MKNRILLQGALNKILLFNIPAQTHQYSVVAHYTSPLVFRSNQPLQAVSLLWAMHWQWYQQRNCLPEIMAMGQVRCNSGNNERG